MGKRARSKGEEHPQLALLVPTMGCLPLPRKGPSPEPLLAQAWTGRLLAAGCWLLPA